MANANTVALELYDGSATLYYLSGTKVTAYAGSGTPWTSNTTTPFRLAVNDEAPSFTPQIAPAPAVRDPLAAMLASPALGLDADPVVQQFSLYMYATTVPNVVALLSLFRQVLGATSYVRPLRLLVTSENVTYPAVYYVYGGDVQESPSYIVEGGSSVVMLRCTVTIVRSPFGSRYISPDAIETLINAATLGNVGTGTPDNLEDYSAGVGDLITEGSPLNFHMRPTNTGNHVVKMWLATIDSRDYASTSNTWSTSGTSFDMSSTAASGSDVVPTAALINLSTLMNNPRLKCRIITILSTTFTGSPEFKFRIEMGTSINANAYVYTPAIPLADTIFTSANKFVLDSGPIPFQITPMNLFTGTLTQSISLLVRSTDGGATTGTLASTEVLYYYDFCEITMGQGWGTTGTTDYTLMAARFLHLNTTHPPQLIAPQAALVNTRSSNAIYEFCQIRGTLPRYYVNSSFWFKAISILASTMSVETARTFTVTAYHSPLYKTLRGS